jgi:hypothetical protein
LIQTSLLKGVIMKKSATVNPAGKSAEVRAEAPCPNAVPARKGTNQYKPCDHSYGRTNRRAIGINHEPGLYF